jgi:hypothetical protein
MATARRVIYSSYVVPQESLALEENTDTELTKYAIESGCGRTFGGKGTVTDVAANQWGESWTSMQHALQFWEDYGSNWEDSREVWNNVGVTVGSSAFSLVLDAAGVTTTAVKFLYIRNLGTASDQTVTVSLDDNSSYKIYIPANGSISLRGDGTTLETQDVWVKRAGSTDTTIEFIIAI